LGSWAEQLEIKVFSVDMGFLLAMLPPGAFISLGLLIAARNWLARRHDN
jgi:electron transport complex protein RnfE